MRVTQKVYISDSDSYNSALEKGLKAAKSEALIKAGVTEYISDIGEVSVSAVKKPEHKVAEGALALAESMPDEEYTSIV